MHAQSKVADNGVNVQALLEAREALTSAPQAAQFKWRASCEWINGTHSRSKVDTFFGLGEEQKHRQTFSYETDHPEIFASKDVGATPVEVVLAGLAGCLTAGIANIAAARGINLTEVSSTVEGDIDLLGIFGLSDEVRNGYQQLRASFTLRGDEPEKLRSVVEQSRRRSAVFDIVTNGVPVSIDVDAG